MRGREGRDSREEEREREGEEGSEEKGEFLISIDFGGEKTI